MKEKKLAKLLTDLKGKKSQAWLAKEMGVTPSRLGTYLRGEIDDISVDFLSHVSNYMGVGLDELVRMLDVSDTAQRMSAKEKSAAYCVAETEKIVEIINGWPLSEQLSLIEKVVSRTRSAIAV